MKKKTPDFITSLESLYDESHISSYKKKKHDLFQRLDNYDRHRREREILSLLKRQYSAPQKAAYQQLKSQTFEIINTQSPIVLTTPFENPFLLWTKRFVALGFASILFAGTALAPFQAIGPFPTLPVVQAAFLECRGSVTVNGQLCDEHQIRTLQQGDRIQTAKNALATVFYADNSLVRFHEKTAVVLDAQQSEVVHVESGSVWVHSPTESLEKSLQIITPGVKLTVPKGSASVSHNESYTELLSATALLEVQIDTPDGKTELVTVPPDKSMMVRNTSSHFAVFDAESTRQEHTWVADNKVKDQEHLAHVKQRTSQEKTLIAGSLPGGVSDYVEKVTKNARTAITWDSNVKSQRQVSELDELLAESLLLYQKGDQTTAQQTFEAYREKLSSLITSESDKIRVKDENTKVSPFASLFKRHAQILSAYDPQDPEYRLRQNVEALALELETTVLATDGELIETVSKQKIVDAHRSVASGEIAAAEQLLNEANDIEDSKVISRSDSVNETVQVLNEIASKSAELEPLAKEIKQKQVGRLKSQEPVVTDVEVLTDVVVGTAVKSSSEESVNTPEDPDDEHYLSSAIGLAVKEDPQQDLE